MQAVFRGKDSYQLTERPRRGGCCCCSSVTPTTTMTLRPMTSQDPPRASRDSATAAAVLLRVSPSSDNASCATANYSAVTNSRCQFTRPCCYCFFFLLIFKKLLR